MKKLICCMLALGMCLSLCACTGPLISLFETPGGRDQREAREDINEAVLDAEEEIREALEDAREDREDGDIKHEISFDWENHMLCSRLPKPEGPIGEIDYNTESNISLDVYETSEDAFDDYVSECRDCGFTEDVTQFAAYYNAASAEGYEILLTVDVDAEIMGINISAPGDGSIFWNDDFFDDDDHDVDTEITVQGMRPEFKKVMDAYEDFFEEYCDIVRSHPDMEHDADWLDDVADGIREYADEISEAGTFNGEPLSDEEMEYYLEVTGRVSQMLEELAEEH